MGVIVTKSCGFPNLRVLPVNLLCRVVGFNIALVLKLLIFSLGGSFPFGKLRIANVYNELCKNTLI